jgi:small subunit ribosomal protein S17
MIKEVKTNEKTVAKSTKRGVVTSDKMDKTIVVKVDSLKKHPRYQKRYTSSKKYKVHDEKNEYGIGDKVAIESCKPISKDKQWRVVSK